ncbi:MAG: RnfABCDGE type electron transport complex subunit D [Ruminococcaceae bacterium]|nr:RnfABCDGE type electron transport complex subunit D [Oscillospiraceae bacterium]
MNNLIVSASPHIRSKANTTVIMRDVIIALMPTLIAAIFIFGWRSLLVVGVCVAFAVLGEWGFEKLCKRDVTIGDLSAVVTGILLGFSLPVGIPLWQAAFGSIVAIVVVKQLFGGIGKNFANPAVTARIVMFIAFAGSMTTWQMPDAVSTATPLVALKYGTGELPEILDLLIGNRAGCIGETSIIALVIGGIYLMIRKVITWHVPVTYLATVFVLTAILGKEPVYQLLSGAVVLAAIFMATDYTTTPQTKKGKFIYGLGCGMITVLIRVWGNYPEGVSFAILLMNILTPHINTLTRSKPLGGVKA